MESATETLESWAAEVAEQHEVPLSKAYEQVLATPRGAELYAQRRLEKLGYIREISNRADIAKGAGQTYQLALSSFRKDGRSELKPRLSF